MIDKQFVDLFERLESTLSGGFKRLAAVAEAQNKQRRAQSSSTLEKRREIRRRSCLLFEVVLTNTSDVEDVFLVLCDMDRPPETGDPITVLGPKVTVGGDCQSLQYAGGRPFERGCFAVASTTADVVTLASENKCRFDSVIEA
jgi:hypothetical protein